MMKKILILCTTFICILSGCRKTDSVQNTEQKSGYKQVSMEEGLELMKECERIIESIEHFYGHMEIECCDRLGLCSVEYKEDLKCRKEELVEFCSKIDQMN